MERRPGDYEGCVPSGGSSLRRDLFNLGGVFLILPRLVTGVPWGGTTEVSPGCETEETRVEWGSDVLEPYL